MVRNFIFRLCVSRLSVSNIPYLYTHVYTHIINKLLHGCLVCTILFTRCERLLTHSFAALTSHQGSYGSWKTWKVMEFQYSKIQAWKSWKINFSHGKSRKIEILHNINEVFYLFQFTSHNNNMNCCYMTDFCKSEVNFVLLYNICYR